MSWNCRGLYDPQWGRTCYVSSMDLTSLDMTASEKPKTRGHAELAQLLFPAPGGKGPRSAAEWSAPWKRSFYASRQDRDKTVVLALASRLAPSAFGDLSAPFRHHFHKCRGKRKRLSRAWLRPLQVPASRAAANVVVCLWDGGGGLR